MKRVKRLKAKGRWNTTSIEITIKVEGGTLVRDKVNEMITDAADRIMAQLPEIKYGKFPLSTVRVS